MTVQLQCRLFFSLKQACKMRPCMLCVLSVLLIHVAVAGAGLDWATGGELVDLCPKLSSTLSRPVTATWRNQELGTIFDRLAATQDVSIWVDRRVNPQLEVNTQLANVSLEMALVKLATAHGLACSCANDVIYIGPPQAAEEFATCVQLGRDRAGSVPKNVRELWLAAEPTSWHRLTEPRNLIEAWLRERSITVRRSDLIPHDLLPAKQLPSMPLVDRMTLLLLGFDLSLEISPNGRACQIVHLARPVKITRTYRLDDAQRRAWRAARDEFMTLDLQVQGKAIQLSARWEDHLRLAATLSGAKSGRRRHQTDRHAATRQVFSLRLKNQPVGKVIEQIAAPLNMEVVWRDIQGDPGNHLEQPSNRRISCDLQNVDLDSLLEGVLTPAGLTYQLDAGQIRIDVDR